jgi:replicative DNA helicase
MTQSGAEDRLPPQAVEIEKAVVGAMLIDGRAVDRAIELLGEDSFYERRHGHIFAAIVALSESGRAIDQLTVGEQLTRRGQLDRIGGVVYLAELVGGVASAANVEYHAEIVMERALGRSLIDASAEISRRAYQAQTKSDELLDWAEQRIFSLSERRSGAGP